VPESDLDLTMPTRDGEEIQITTARFTNLGIAEVAVTSGATIITAKQARELAAAFDKLATFWGE
jgi:hypothetical protein